MLPDIVRSASGGEEQYDKQIFPGEAAQDGDT